MKDNKIIDTKTPMLPIGTMAITLGVHQRTLRIYDKEGILSPARTDKNRRYYSLDDIEKGKLILFLTRNLALNISGVKIILAILEEQKIKPDEYLTYIENMANKAKISVKEQEINIEKASKKGRKAKED